MRLVRPLLVAALLGLVTAIALAFACLAVASPRGAMIPSTHFQGWFGWIAARQEGVGLTWINLDRIDAPFVSGTVDVPSVPAWAAPSRDDSDDRSTIGPCRVATLAVGWPWRWATLRFNDRTGASAAIPAAELDDDGEAMRRAAAEMLRPSRWGDVRVRGPALVGGAALAAVVWFATLVVVSALRRGRAPRGRDSTASQASAR